MINNVNLSGNVTRDADRRGTGDKPYITFGLAVTEYRGHEDKSTMFFSCIMFGKRAAAVAEFINKGSKVCVSGKLGSDNYTDKNGIEHTGFSILVNDLELMSARQEQNFQGW